MADYVDGLSDAELRTKLAEYGFPVVPITATTRKIMMKKLKLLIQNKNKINSDGRRSLAKYSSGEESDNDIDTSRQKDKNRRVTLGGAMLPPPPSKLRKNAKKSETPEKEPIRIPSPQKPSPAPELKQVTTTTTTKRVTKTIRPADEVDFEDGSDSDIEVVEEESPKEAERSRTSYYSSIRSPASGTGSGLRLSGASPAGTSSYASPYNPSSVTSSGNKALDDLNRIRARLSLGSTLPSTSTSTYSRRPTYSSPYSNKEEDSKFDTPYLSQFSRKLSQVTGTNKRDDFEYKRDIIKENEAANGNTFSRTFQSRFGLDRDTAGMSREFKQSQEKNIFKNNVVSFTLIGIACAFFVAISFLYVGMRNESGTLLEPVGDLPYCSANDLLMKPGIHCIKKESVKDAMNFLNKIVPELTKRAVNAQCNGDPKIMPYMTDNTVIEYITQTTGYNDQYQIKDDLYNLQVLVLHNSDKWGIDLIESKPSYDPESSSPKSIRNVDELQAARGMKRVALLMRNVDLPLSCIVFSKLYSVFVSLFVIAAGFGLVYFGQKAVKHYMKQKAEQERQVYAMVERIINVLSSNTQDEGQNYLAVNHIRDMLIPVFNRKSMSSVWDSAVNFIENNESRVRPEIQIIAGEQYKVWRWLDNPIGSLKPKGKVWQGQAFETQEGSVNSLPVSPTQCLKIRHMFDTSETSPNWMTVIKDTILEKCGDNCRIYHIGIDKMTCCVYLKCASEKDAGVAYKNLHGWWYDGNLITVKYLRLERYMERFPDSPSSGPFLKPSTDRRHDLRNDWSSGARDD